MLFEGVGEDWFVMTMRKTWRDGSPVFQSGNEDCDTVLVLQEPADGSVKAPLENCDSGDFIEHVLNFLRSSKERRFERYCLEMLRIINTCPWCPHESWKTKRKRITENPTLSTSKGIFPNRRPFLIPTATLSWTRERIK